MLAMKDIQTLYKCESVVLTQHFMYKIERRRITLTDIDLAIISGEIIEQYPDDYPHPSALILGTNETKEPLHIVVGVGRGTAWLITAYHPDPMKWEDDNRTRKVEN